MNHTPVLCFDFDGVIANTFAACLEINQLVTPELTADEYRQRFTGNINDSQADRATRNQFDFWSEYNKRLLQTPVTPHLPETLATVSQNYTCLIVSSTISASIKLFLDHHNLTHYFHAILGNDVSPSKVVKFKQVFSQYQVTGARSLFITDTLGDIKEATEVDLPTIAVTWGYHGRAYVSQGNPIVILDDPAELTLAISQVLPATE